MSVAALHSFFDTVVDHVIEFRNDIVYLKSLAFCRKTVHIYVVFADDNVLRVRILVVYVRRFNVYTNAFRTRIIHLVFLRLDKTLIRLDPPLSACRAARIMQYGNKRRVFIFARIVTRDIAVTTRGNAYRKRCGNRRGKGF